MLRDDSTGASRLASGPFLTPFNLLACTSVDPATDTLLEPGGRNAIADGKCLVATYTVTTVYTNLPA